MAQSRLRFLLLAAIASALASCTIEDEPAEVAAVEPTAGDEALAPPPESARLARDPVPAPPDAPTDAPPPAPPPADVPAAAPPEPPPTPAPAARVCTSRADCGPHESCTGPEGCGTPWTCGPSRMCTRDLVTYCGCDGQTFRSSSTCPGRPWARRGACAPE